MFWLEHSEVKSTVNMQTIETLIKNYSIIKKAHIHTPQNTCDILFKARKKLTYFIDTLTYVIYHGKSINRKKFGDFSVTFLKRTELRVTATDVLPL